MNTIWECEIKPLNQQALISAREKIDHLAKPLGSLGKLEDMAIQMAGIFGEIPFTLGWKRVVVFASDNGVWNEGISPVPQSVTLKQAVNMTRGLTGVCAMARYAGCEVKVVDMGINAHVKCPEMIDRKLAMGTRNIAQGPAMSREQAYQALMTGFELAKQAKAQGVRVLAAGEMGICNTTTSAAVLSALTGMPATDTVGKGAGLTEEQFQKKRQVVERALEINQPDPGDPIGVLQKVGGFDIGGMAGLYIGSAAAGLPVVVDGFIAMVAAALAVRIRPEVKNYLFASHVSNEKAFMAAAQAVGVKPYLDMGMRLGEGSACPLAMMMMEAALRMAHDMLSFDEADIDINDYIDIRGE